MRVFPALMDETEFRPASIFDEPIAIDVAIMINPREGTLDVRPNRLNKRAVTCAFEIRAGEHDEKWCCVDAAVVTLERNFAQDRHLTRACLVQYLAWLRILLGVLRVCLRSSQIGQDPTRQTWIEPHALQRGNNSV